MENKSKLLKFLLFGSVQILVPAVLIIILQKFYLLNPRIITSHLLVILSLNLFILGLGFLLYSNKLKSIRSAIKYLIAGLFGILNVLLYYTYLFTFLGIYFNSKIFTLEIVIGYFKYLDDFITNLAINPFLVYGVLFVIPILIFVGFLLLSSSIQFGLISLRKYLLKHNFNNPSTFVRYKMIAFFLVVGFLTGMVYAKRAKIPFHLFKIEEPVATVFFKNDPFDGRILSDKNEDIGVRSSYPKNIDFQKKNVVIIVVDALRSDHLSLFGYDRKTSPFLDSLYASGNLRRVDLSFSPAAESFAGINAILRSKIWSHLGYNNFSLQHLLKDQGYDLNFIVSGDHANFSGLKSFYGKNSDFDFYLDGSDTDKYSDPNDDRIILEGLESVSQYDQTPAYFHFHLMSVHNLGVRLNNFSQFKPAGRTIFDARNYINRYDNGVLQADNYIKEIFKSLSDKGYLENSIVVITGDHGEALGERGKFGHSRNIYTDQILTPILFYDPENVDYRNTSYASLVDIAPTIIDRLGLPVPDSWEGISLLDEESRQLTYHQQGSQYAIIHNKANSRYKLIYDSKTKKQELYELNSDLYEARNLIDSLDMEYLNTLRWYMTEFDLDPERLYEY